MTDLTIAFLPSVPGEQYSWREVAADVAAYNHKVRLIRDLPPTSLVGDLDLTGAWVAHCALELASEEVRTPTLLVAHGEAGKMLAALGFSQKASRRRVVGYVIVDGELPKPGLHDWPDAPVTYVGSKQARQAGLRGWELLTGEDVAADIRQVAAESV